MKHSHDNEVGFQVGDEITYSGNNKDYSIVNMMYPNSKDNKIYQLLACDVTNETQQLQLNCCDEDKMKLTNCLDVLTKAWPNLEYKSNGEFTELLTKKVLSRICGVKKLAHSINISSGGNSFKLIFDGVEFTKTK